MGADDYVTKPFDQDVLLAHIKAVLRRSAEAADLDTQGSEILTIGDLKIDAAARTVTLRGKPVELPRLEFDLLHTLALHAGHVLSLDDLLARVWGPEYVGEPQVVYVHIRWLREKLEEDPHDPRRIITVRGVGYRLEPQET
jgi:DNA-binding response OmpR family regulator